MKKTMKISKEMSGRNIKKPIKQDKESNSNGSYTIIGGKKFFTKDGNIYISRVGRCKI